MEHARRLGRLAATIISLIIRAWVVFAFIGKTHLFKTKGDSTNAYNFVFSNFSKFQFGLYPFLQQSRTLLLNV